ncbi:hypothetical protein Drorol1_Dr00008158 [Drosera rotundifolia]
MLFYLGHFSQLSIQAAFTFVVYPAFVLAYMGQAAHLSLHHFLSDDSKVAFYVSLPGIELLIRFGLPWWLITAVLFYTGLAVITVMLVRTCLMALVIVLCWQGSIFYAIGFFSFFGTLEALYLSASPFKFLEGAWFVVALSIILSSSVLELCVSVALVSLKPHRACFCMLAIFSLFVTNLCTLHQILVFLCFNFVLVSHIKPEELFLVSPIRPRISNVPVVLGDIGVVTFTRRIWRSRMIWFVA